MSAVFPTLVLYSLQDFGRLLSMKRVCFVMWFCLQSEIIRLSSPLFVSDYRTLRWTCGIKIVVSSRRVQPVFLFFDSYDSYRRFRASVSLPRFFAPHLLLFFPLFWCPANKIGFSVIGVLGYPTFLRKA